MASREPPSVWLDTDMALGSSRGDVDDGFALAALLGAARSGRISLLGISAVGGNAPAPEAERCARRLVAVSGVSVDVVAGGSDSAAAIAALPEGAAIVAIGPLTNVAAAVKRDPELPRRTGLRVVGGNLSSVGFFPPVWPHEFNLARDRFAARDVLAAPWRDLVLFPLDVVERLRCDAGRLAAIARLGPVGELLARDSARWAARARWRWAHRSGAFPVWDLPPALAAAGALDVETCERVFPRIQRRAAGIPLRVQAAIAFDADLAWRAFDALLEIFRADPT